MSVREVVALLREHEIPVAPVVEPWFARDDPHTAARGNLVSLRGPEGSVDPGWLGAAMPLRFDTETPVTEAPESLGASTDAVLGELCGYDTDRLAELRDGGAFG